jgi:Raf kinase inhibitor-like YbhB/YbcL family protein
MLGNRLALSVGMLLAWQSSFAERLVITSTSYPEGAEIPTRYGADVCGGGGVSPQVRWTGLPAGTQSVVVLLIDADGANGLTVTHWLAYNISPSRMQLGEGEAQREGPGVTLGKNVSGDLAYRGMCPPVGDTPHHYYLSVIATDLKPGALPSGMTRDELMTSLKGHALLAQSYFARYQR